MGCLVKEHKVVPSCAMESCFCSDVMPSENPMPWSMYWDQVQDATCSLGGMPLYRIVISIVVVAILSCGFNVILHLSRPCFCHTLFDNIAPRRRCSQRYIIGCAFSRVLLLLGMSNFFTVPLVCNAVVYTFGNFCLAAAHLSAYLGVRHAIGQLDTRYSRPIVNGLFFGGLVGEIVACVLVLTGVISVWSLQLQGALLFLLLGVASFAMTCFSFYLTNLDVHLSDLTSGLSVMMWRIWSPGFIRLLTQVVRLCLFIAAPMSLSAMNLVFVTVFRGCEIGELYWLLRLQVHEF